MQRDLAGFPVLSLLATACSGGADRKGGERREEASATAALPVDTLITTASGVLGDPTDLEVADDGALFVLDGLNSEVHRVDPDGEYSGAFGVRRHTGISIGSDGSPSRLRRSRG